MVDICYIVYSKYPDDPRIRREAEVLTSNGMKLDIICLKKCNEKSYERLGLVSVYRILKEPSKKEKIHKYLLLTIIFTIFAFIKLNILYIRKRYKIIQIHNMPDYLIFTCIIQKVIRKKIIFDMHDLTPELFQSKWGKNTIFIKIIKTIEKIACKLSNHIITTSYGFKNNLIKRGIDPKKITLVLNSADERVFNPKKVRKYNKIKENVNLIYHGTVATRFGVHVAIKAIHIVKNIMPMIKLSIYGKYDPSYKIELEVLIRDLNLNNNIELNGFIKWEELAKIIDVSDIGVVPYISDTFMDLALSTKTFEYIVMNLPIVATRLPSLMTIFDEKCIKYCDSNDPNDMANKIIEMCQNYDKIKYACENAATKYEKINWEKMKETYIDVINEQIKQ